MRVPPPTGPLCVTYETAGALCANAGSVASPEGLTNSISMPMMSSAKESTTPTPSAVVTEMMLSATHWVVLVVVGPSRDDSASSSSPNCSPNSVMIVPPVVGPLE